MSIDNFIRKPLSDWMKQEQPDTDIVISSRIRLARNLRKLPFPLLAIDSQREELLQKVKEMIEQDPLPLLEKMEMIRLDQLSPLEKKVLVEKHLISPQLSDESRLGAVVISENEDVSIMLNEEDHIRIQCLYPGLQIDAAWNKANEIDDWIESQLDYAFDEERGYLTSCPTNVGTGIRASVMIHLPALVMTKQASRFLTALNQVGLAVRGIYGEGSEALGNLFQVSNQITLGQSETEIIEHLGGVVRQLIEHERAARDMLLHSMKLQLEDKIWRSFGILSNARSMESKEATARLSDVFLGVNLGMIQNLSASQINELWVMLQPGFLQTHFSEPLTPELRDERRATLIREQLQGIDKNRK